MQSDPVAEYLASTPEDSRPRRKMEKAVKRLRRVKTESLKQARADFAQAKKDLSAASEAFKRLVDNFGHAVADLSEKGRDPAHAAEDYDKAREDADGAEEKLGRTSKALRHALKDFAEALEDLKRVGKIAGQIAAAAQEAGHKGVTVELVRLAIKKAAAAPVKAKEPKEQVEAPVAEPEAAAA
jgi:ABC-type transporter Mla subunit MlaD